MLLWLQNLGNAGSDQAVPQQTRPPKVEGVYGNERPEPKRRVLPKW